MTRAPLYSPRLVRYYFAFFVIGFFTVMAGPLLPWFALRFSLQPSQSGALFFAQFAASTIGALVSGFYPRITSRVGVACIAFGTAAASFGNWPFTMAAFAIGGLGYGLAVPVINMAVAEDTGSDPRPLNVLNAFWGIGAFVAPIALEGNRAPRIMLAVFGLMAVAAAVLLPSPPVRAPREVDVNIQRWTLMPIVIFSAVMFFYIGSESAVGGWIPTLAAAAQHNWMPAASAFWGALVLGRLLAPSLFNYMSARSVLYLGVITAAVAVLALWHVPGVPLLLLALIAGLGHSSLFPTLVAVFSKHVSKPVVGMCFAIGSMGGAVIPWIAGFAASSTGSVRAAFAVALASLVVLFTTIALSGRRSQHT